MNKYDVVTMLRRKFFVTLFFLSIADSRSKQLAKIFDDRFLFAKINLYARICARF